MKEQGGTCSRIENAKEEYPIQSVCAVLYAKNNIFVGQVLNQMVTIGLQHIVMLKMKPTDVLQAELHVHNTEVHK